MNIPKDVDCNLSSLSVLPSSVVQLFAFWSAFRLTQIAVRTLSTFIVCPDRGD